MYTFVINRHSGSAILTRDNVLSFDVDNFIGSILISSRTEQYNHSNGMIHVSVEDEEIEIGEADSVQVFFHDTLIREFILSSPSTQ